MVDRPPLVSVIVAVFNGAKTLQQCIDSILAQSYGQIELIIADGGSSDGTVEILERNSDAIAAWISQRDNGIYDAWNKALGLAQGQWICFLGADDYLWGGSVIEKFVAALHSLPEDVNIVYGKVMLLTEEGGELYAVGEPWDKAREKFKSYMSIPHQGVMHRRSLFEKHGLFDASYKIAGDYELLLRELKSGEAAYVPDLIVAGMRRGGVSSNPEYSLISIRETRRAQRTHGQVFPRIGWMFAIAKVKIKNLAWKALGERRARIFLDWLRRLGGKPAYWSK